MSSHWSEHNSLSLTAAGLWVRWRERWEGVGGNIRARQSHYGRQSLAHLGRWTASMLILEEEEGLYGPGSETKTSTAVSAGGVRTFGFKLICIQMRTSWDMQQNCETPRVYMKGYLNIMYLWDVKRDRNPQRVLGNNFPCASIKLLVWNWVRKYVKSSYNESRQLSSQLDLLCFVWKALMSSSV